MSTLGKLASMLHNLGACTGTLDKIELLQASEDWGYAREMLRWALDPYQKFGIKKIPFVNYAGGEPANWMDVVDFLKRSAAREITGDIQKAELTELLRRMPTAHQDVLRRVLLKDLRCGVGATLVNKAIPGLVPEFGIMLAEPLEPKHIKRLNRQEWVYFQPKKNGDRSVHIINESPQAYSRKGFPQLNYDHITATLAKVCGRCNENFAFDGEVIIDKSFWGTRKVKKLAGNQADNAVLHVFDIVPLAQWNDNATIPYGRRRNLLKNLWDFVSPDMPLQRVPSYRVKGSDVTWELIEEWRMKFVEQGDEGLIIRLDVPYNFKTRNSLFKRKVMLEDDFMILEIREGEEGKKYEGMAAKVLVDLGGGVTCEVGLKGDMETRKELWEHRNKYVGMVAEVHYQEKTVNEEGEPRLQFGIMHRIREDKS